MKILFEASIKKREEEEINKERRKILT